MNFTRGISFNKIKKISEFSLSLDSIHRFSLYLENIFFYHLKEKGSEVYYFKEKHEVDFVCKSGLKITELFNVCYQLENKETISGEIASLIEGMKYFNLKEGTIIVAEGENKKIVESGFKINIIPFYQWALYY